jgi:hypothetical protein
MNRQIDIVRVRKGLLPKGEKGEKVVKDLISALKSKSTTIEETKESLIIWENVDE